MLEGDWWQHMEHVGLYFQQMSSFSLVEPAQKQEGLNTTQTTSDRQKNILTHDLWGYLKRN